jgi:signal transduction histidine kinase
VLVRARATDAGVEVAIADDGPGIPSESLGEVIEGGVRLDQSVPGTGIGLAIARDLIELNQGRLELGQGPLGGLQAIVGLATNSGSATAPASPSSTAA